LISLIIYTGCCSRSTALRGRPSSHVARRVGHSCWTGLEVPHGFLTFAYFKYRKVMKCHASKGHNGRMEPRRRRWEDFGESLPICSPAPPPGRAMRRDGASPPADAWASSGWWVRHDPRPLNVRLFGRFRAMNRLLDGCGYVRERKQTAFRMRPMSDRTPFYNSPMT
jgi:hypothetical protein